MRISNWYRLYVCVECEKRLNYNQRTNNNATCPFCGHTARGTICDTKSVIAREIKHHSWWEFWNRRYSYEGKDDFSKNWLKTH